MDIIPDQIWKIVGDQPGPTFCILGGTHGDEVVGVEVVDRLLSRFVDNKSDQVHSLNGLSGTLYLGFGNPQAIQEGVRGTGGADLNRSFDPVELESPQTLDDRRDLCRARELYPLLQSVDILIDIHNTHADSEPFICTGVFSQGHHDVVSQIPVTKILIDPDSILPQDVGRKILGTTDSVVNTHGGVGIAYETGSKTDRSHIGQVEQTLLQIMGLLPRKESHQQKVYRLSSILKAPRSGEIVYTQEYVQGWAKTEDNQIIAYIEDIPVFAPQKGILLFQKHRQQVQKGDSIGYLVDLTIGIESV